MEDIQAKHDDTGIDEKFERILKYYDPMLVIALFHRKARMDGVIFGIGVLCGLYGTRNIGQRLRFLTESGYNFKAMTLYITTLFPKIRSVPFDDSKEYTNPAKLIDVFVVTKCWAVKSYHISLLTSHFSQLINSAFTLSLLHVSTDP